MPYLTIGKNTAAEADGYVTGLKLGTGFPFNRNVERKFGRVPKLGPGQSRTYELEYGVHEGVEADGQFTAMITGLQGEPPRLLSQPPVIPNE